MATPAPLNEREDRAWQSYRRMHAELIRCIRRELARDTGLSDTDYEVLHVLSEAPDQAMRALALRSELRWEKSRLSHQIARMQRRGLVTREECEEDSRGSVVRLTHAGNALAAAACTEYARAVRTYLIDRLSPAQLDALADISTTVLAALAED